jgi:hypothetical protein
VADVVAGEHLVRDLEVALLPDLVVETADELLVVLGSDARVSRLGGSPSRHRARW